MFELIFGTFWTGITAFATFGFLATNAEEGGGDSLSIILFLGIFWAVGIFMLAKGLKKIIANSMTAVKGEECFGKIINVYPSGCYVNGVPELKADVLCYIPSEVTTETISEIVGLGSPKYPVGSYVRVKYYNGDINFEGSVNEEAIPFSIKESIDSLSPSYANNDSPSIIEVDGVKYKRLDE